MFQSLPLMMMRGIGASVVATCVVILFSVFAGPSEAQTRREDVRRARRPIPGRYLVVLRGNEDPDTAAVALQPIGRGRVRHVYRHALRGLAIETSEAGARALAREPGVLMVEEDGIVYMSGAQPLGADDSWGLDRVDQRIAITADGWPSYDGIYRYSGDGRGVNVYVVDTGIRATHIEFGGRAVAAFDAMGEGRSDGDCHGHGTHVAGTVGGSRLGVAKQVTLHSVRALGCDGYGSYSGLALAIDWITAHHVKPAVISMSIGGGLSDTVNEAIRNAIATGITFVGAAGNEGDDSCLHLMGGVPEALVVGASGYNDWREWYSNTGSCLDLFAPGGNITSAYGGSDAGFTIMSGTSMATPHVSGAAALYLQGKPDATPAEVAAAITRSATLEVIQDAGLNSPNRLLFTPHFGDRVPPTASLVQPLSRSIIRGSQHVLADVQDDVEVATVTFLAGGIELGTDVTVPYSLEWDTTAWADGTYAVTAVAHDLAGNHATKRVSVEVRNGRAPTPPRLSVTAERPYLPPGGHRVVPVAFTGTAVDNVSPIGSVSFAVHDEYSRMDGAGTVSVADGHFSITVLLESSRRGQDSDGRKYTVTVTATDAEGSEASATAYVTVTHDNSSARAHRSGSGGKDR